MAKKRYESQDNVMSSSSTPFPTTRLSQLAGSNGPIHALTFSSGSGQYILAGSADRCIRIYKSTATNPNKPQSPIQTFRAHGYEVLDLAVSQDNSRFVSVGGDKTVFLWDVASGTTIRRFAGHAARVNCVDFGRDGGGSGEESVIVTGSFDGTVKVWDLKARGEKPVMTFDEARDSVSDVKVRGGEIFVASVDGRVRVYDLAAGMLDTDVIGASVTSLSPAAVDGESYLVGSLDSRLRLMDRRTGKCLQTFKHGDFVNETYRLRSTLAMADAYAMSGAEDGSVFVWDVLSGELKHRVWHKQGGNGSGSGSGNKKDVVSAVAWNQTRKTWASAGGDGTVIVWGSRD